MDTQNLSGGHFAGSGLEMGGGVRVQGRGRTPAEGIGVLHAAVAAVEDQIAVREVHGRKVGEVEIRGIMIVLVIE